MIESIIDDILLSSPGVTGMVNTRVRPLVRTQDLPCVSFRKTDQVQEINIDGESVGMIEAEVEITCYAKRLSELKTLFGHVKSQMVNHTGIIDGINIHLVVYGSDDDSYDQDSEIYLNESNFTIYFEG